MPYPPPVNAFIEGLDPAAGLLIDGRRRGAAATFEVQDPATAHPLTHVADAGLAEATDAVDAAAAAGPSWAATAPRARADILYRTYQRMLDDIDRLSTLIMAENGKCADDARGEVVYAAEFFRWFAEEAVRTGGGYGSPPAGMARTITTQRPVGVAALVTPWNFPAAMATRKIAPALAAGCTAVLKPAEETPLTALAIADLLLQAGAPAGVLNVVPTTQAPTVVSAWLNDSRVRKISFTGSTTIGRVLLAQAAQRVVNCSMELGGNAPFIVTEDADLDAAVSGALVAKFRNGGQACTAANRFLVHAKVAAAFASRFGAAVNDLRVGPAARGSVQIGPVITAAAASRIESSVEEAVGGGARVTHRADVDPDLTGHFVAPKILQNVAPDAPIVAEEIFGPIAPIVACESNQQILEVANSSESGLAAYVYAGSLQRALQLAEGLEAGMVGINRGIVSDPSAPFGGVKQSGLGREGAREGLLEYTETQYFSVDWPESPS